MNKELLMTVVIAILSSGFINTIIAHILHRNRLTVENQKKVEKSMDDQILEALLKARELAHQIFTLEIYDCQGIIKQGNFDAYHPEVVYPEIMNSPQYLKNYLDAITDFRKRYDLYLSRTIALNIIFIDRYLRQLQVYSNGWGESQIYPYIGAWIYIDLQKWAFQFDDLLVKKINRRKYKLQSHQGWLWKKQRRKIVEQQWEETLLYAMLNGTSKDKKTGEDAQKASSFIAIRLAELKNNDKTTGSML